MKKILMSIFLLFVLVVSPLASNADVNVHNVIPQPVEVYQGTQLVLNVNISNDPGVTVPEAIDITVVSSDLEDGNGNTIDATEYITLDPILLPDVEEDGTTTNVQVIIDVPANQATGVYIATITATNIDDPENDFDTQAYSIEVVEAPNPSLTISGLDDNELIMDGQEDRVLTDSLTITNNGNIDFTNLRMSLLGNFVEDENEIILTVDNQRLYPDERVVNLGNLNAQDSLEVTITATIPDGIAEDTYSGDATIFVSNYEEVTQTFDLSVRVEPEICKDGRVSDEEDIPGPNAGNIRISGFDVDDDDLDLGDTIEAEVTVENEYTNDMDIVVEAMLYNLDKNEEIIEWTEVAAENIDEDDEQDFDFDLEIPLDNEDIDPDDTFVLYVKAYEDGDEKINCNYDRLEIDIDREDDYVIVNKFTINPTIASQGDLVSLSVGALNIGNDDQDDSYITVTSTELGLELTSLEFNIDKYNDKDNDMLKTFTFTVPEEVEAGDYRLEARIYYRSGKEYQSAWGTLTVEGESTEVSETEVISEDSVDTIVGTTGAGTYQPTGSSVFDSIGSTKTLFIIGDVVLVILAILFLVLIFRRR